MEIADELEMLHHLLSAPSTSEGHMALRAQDKTSSGDNMAFLSSKLTWEIGDDGKERVIDADGNGVMMGWEEPLSTYPFSSPLDPALSD